MVEPVGRQDPLFYEFSLDEAVPEGHSLRPTDREIGIVPRPENLFTNNHADTNGGLTSPPNPAPLGVQVGLKASADLISLFFF